MRRTGCAAREETSHPHADAQPDAVPHGDSHFFSDPVSYAPTPSHPDRISDAIPGDRDAH